MKNTSSNKKLELDLLAAFNNIRDANEKN